MADRSTKRTYTIATSTVQEFEKVVPAGERSRVIEGLLKGATASIVRERRRTSIEEGLAYMADVYEETAAEWAQADKEAWPKP